MELKQILWTRIGQIFEKDLEERNFFEKDVALYGLCGAVDSVLDYRVQTEFGLGFAETNSLRIEMLKDLEAASGLGQEFDPRDDFCGYWWPARALVPEGHEYSDLELREADLDRAMLAYMLAALREVDIRGIIDDYSYKRQKEEASTGG